MIYKDLTRHLPVLTRGSEKEIFFAVEELVQAVYRLMQEHPELHLNEYQRIMEKNGITARHLQNDLDGFDYSRISRNCAAAVIMFYIRAERFAEGSFRIAMDKGIIVSCLRRLEQPDRETPLRKMTIADYDEVYDLWLSCRGMGLNDLDDSREGIARYLARNPDTCFVWEEEGEIIGAILSGHDGRRGMIHHTAVHPDRRRRGIGAKLVEAALDALKKEGIHKVMLVAFSRNGSGNAFWEKMGFTLRTDLSYRNRTLTQMTRIDT